MIFKTSESLDTWMKKHQKECHSRATAGEQFVWEFLPNAIIECQTIKCMICNKEFTDYVD